MIRNILYKLEAQLVNMASDPAVRELERLHAMKELVMEAAVGIKAIENVFSHLDDAERVQLMSVRKRILHYIVYFEFEIQDLMGMKKPTIETLKPLYANASYEEWSIAIRSAENNWRKPLLPREALQLHTNSNQGLKFHKSGQWNADLS